jgi:hypothetical protein
MDLIMDSWPAPSARTQSVRRLSASRNDAEIEATPANMRSLQNEFPVSLSGGALAPSRRMVGLRGKDMDGTPRHERVVACMKRSAMQDGTS